MSSVADQKLLSTVRKANKDMDKLHKECDRWTRKAGDSAAVLEGGILREAQLQADIHALRQEVKKLKNTNTKEVKLLEKLQHEALDKMQKQVQSLELSCHWWKDKHNTTHNLYQDSLLLQNKLKAENASFRQTAKRTNLAHKKYLNQLAMDNKTRADLQAEEHNKLHHIVQTLQSDCNRWEMTVKDHRKLYEDGLMRGRQMQSDLEVLMYNDLPAPPKTYFAYPVCFRCQNSRHWKRHKPKIKLTKRGD